LYGLLSSNADIRFVGTGGARGIADSLSGSVSLQLKDGSIANMDLLHQLAGIAQFLRTPGPVQPSTRLFQLTGNFQVSRGVARTNNLEASIQGGSLAASGTINLPRQMLDLRAVAVLSKEYSQSVGGTSIGGFMTTAVANQNGELVIPVMITGTFQNPRFAPDLQEVAKMKLEQLVPTVDNPGELTVGILERIFSREKPGPAEDPERTQETQPTEDEPPPPRVIPDLLDRIFRGTQQEQNETER
jgi:AsmA protein